MRKLIALSTLVLTSSVMAQTTSTTEVKNKKPTFKEKMSYIWFAEATDTIAGNSNDASTRDVDFFNSFVLNYSIKKDVQIGINPTFNIADTPGNSDDKFQEGDLRFRVTGSVFSSKIWTSITYIMPTSQATIDADNTDGQIRFFNLATEKFDQYNTLLYGAGIRKYLNKNQSDDRLYRFLPYLSYSNTKLSEKVSFRADWEGSLWHVADESITTLKADGGTGQRLLLGPDFSKVASINSIYPYMTYYPGLVKSTDQLGMGLQIFKTF